MRLWMKAGLLVLGYNFVQAGSAEQSAPEGTALAVSQSLRPTSRPEAQDMVEAPESESFSVWLKGFKARAAAQGIRPATLEQAFADVTYDAEVVRRDRSQNEFTKTVWDYLDSAASDARIAAGKAALAKHKALLERIEAKYGVDKEIVVAIWGLESAYGSFRGSDSTIRSLATLAYDQRRREFFENELMELLRIVDAGDVRLADLKGSWAGAMGHTQFMPSSFQAHAVDFTGDGRRDIWSEDPSDALASTAAYLKHFGWTKGQPWGVEVTLPEGFTYTLANRQVTKTPADWAALGVLGLDGKPVPDHGRASILLPGGGAGAAFMIFDNFEVLEHYNTADAYVIGVGHLADRISGGKPVQHDWPRGDRALTFDERVELQRLLTAKGFDTVKLDGRIGPLTINAVRAYQMATGLLPDGYASLRLLETLR